MMDKRLLCLNSWKYDTVLHSLIKAFLFHLNANMKIYIFFKIKYHDILLYSKSSCLVRLILMNSVFNVCLVVSSLCL